jgi:hypothetical protein
LTVLIVMGGILIAIAGALIWVVRTGLVGDSVDTLATVVAGPTPTATPPSLVVDAVPTAKELYWPAAAQPLATPDAPSDLRWWDARFAFRRPIVFDEVSARYPTGTWVRILFDGEGAQREGKMREDGADLRIVVWDGNAWWEIPLSATPRREKRGWNLMFALQDAEILDLGGYYLYYGNLAASSAIVPDAVPDSTRLLLTVGPEEGVEWGPEITWTANSTTTQQLVSPDGRVVIQCPPGGPPRDTRVRLRTVPVGERNSYGPLPDFELHANPPPIPLEASRIVYWDPALIVTINWTGLPVDPEDLTDWAYFVYSEDAGAWYPVPVEFDPEQGVTRMITDQL